MRKRRQAKVLVPPTSQRMFHDSDSMDLNTEGVGTSNENPKDADRTSV